MTDCRGGDNFYCGGRLVLVLAVLQGVPDDCRHAKRQRRHLTESGEGRQEQTDEIAF